MYDKRGVFRGCCTECPDNACAEFDQEEGRTICGYCGCPPLKHEERHPLPSAAASTSEQQTDQNNISDLVCDEEQQIDSSVAAASDVKNDVVSAVGSEALKVLDLPSFSAVVKNALMNGSIQDHFWATFIMECANFYVDNPLMCNKSAYSIVGERMLGKYPVIASVGRKPWSKFIRCLSQKIRKERLRRKGFEKAIEIKQFDNLTSSKPSSSRKRKLTDTYRYFRAEVTVPTTASDEVVEVKRKMTIEFNKKQPEMALMKSYLRETFLERTKILGNGISFSEFLKEYPCFANASYFLYEFGIILGRKGMEDMKSEMKTLFETILRCQSEAPDNYDSALTGWLWFEKKCAITQTKGEKSSSIIEVFEDVAEYMQKLRDVDTDISPCAVIHIEGENIKDAAILYSGTFIRTDSVKIMPILTFLLAIYYSLELNYPKKYLQAMGALASFVLKHNFYKLGSRSIKLLNLLKNHKP